MHIPDENGKFQWEVFLWSLYIKIKLRKINCNFKNFFRFNRLACSTLSTRYGCGHHYGPLRICWFCRFQKVQKLCSHPSPSIADLFSRNACWNHRVRVDLTPRCQIQRRPCADAIRDERHHRQNFLHRRRNAHGHRPRDGQLWTVQFKGWRSRRWPERACCNLGRKDKPRKQSL